MKYFALTFSNGLMGFHEQGDDESIEQEIAKGIGSQRLYFDDPDLEVVSFAEVLLEQLPEDRTYRGAWRHCPQNGVRHCIDTARGIQKDYMRRHREGRFAQTDLALVRGVVEARDTSAISDMVQRLRDVTKHPGIEAAETVEDLKKVWPSVLDEPVPALGGVRISGDADYDTKALESWAQSLTEKIAALEAQRAEAPIVDLSEIQAKLAALEEKLAAGVDMKDVQVIAQGVHNLAEEAKSLKERLKKAEDDATYALKHAIVDARLTEDKLQ